MGYLIHAERSRFEIDDHLLAHLRIVVANKLRRGEPFMLQLPHPQRGTSSIWVAPSSPLLFTFFTSRTPNIEPALIAELMEEVSEPDGLTLFDTSTDRSHMKDAGARPTTGADHDRSCLGAT